ncbi:DUF6879 family protein [Actinomadura flavalba]|uniref:DUF6879 family protein n=1 Tax=Actinomadura flavalba TaxID=1120938 RepID=UPI0004763B7E|nr:DUF6879 family protein [Actinomadura flavalba]
MIQILSELFARAERSVTHLEMRDGYGVSEPDYRAWCEGASVDQLARSGSVVPWVELVGSVVARGVTFRRARVVSEPVSDYIRFEHAVTGYSNLAAGEQVRWLSRRQAADLALPGADFWQIDDGTVCFVFQSGDGEPAGYELTENLSVVKLCSMAFEAVWDRGIEHAEYRPA